MTPGLETSQAQSYDEETEEEEVIDPFDVGYEGDGKTLKPGATFSSGEELLLKMHVEKGIEEGKINVVDGPSPNPQTLEMSPAKEAARQMQKLIHDQIEESNGSSELRNAIFEAALIWYRYC